MHWQARVALNAHDPAVARLSAVAAPLAQRSPSVLQAWVVDSTDPWWTELLEAARAADAIISVEARFEDVEVATAPWCVLSCSAYPQRPRRYQQASFDTTHACPGCAVGVRQIAPLRLAGEPPWGRSTMFLGPWNPGDALLVRSDVYLDVLAGFDIECREVLDRAGDPLQTVVQLIVGEVVDLADNQASAELCGICGTLKLHGTRLDYGPLPVAEPAGPLVVSAGWYGSGGLAVRTILVRDDLVRAIRERRLRGIRFLPCGSPRGLHPHQWP